jgi:flagellar protein FlaG
MDINERRLSPQNLFKFYRRMPIKGLKGEEKKEVGNMNVSPVENNVIASIAVALPRQDSARPVQTVSETVVNNEKLRQQVAEMQSQISKMNVSMQFSTYGEHGEKIAVVVADKETGEVIREIPSQEIQTLYAKMSELAGIIFNRQV